MKGWAKRIYYDGSVYVKFADAYHNGTHVEFLTSRIDEYLVDDVHAGKISKLALKTERAFFALIDMNDLADTLMSYNPSEDD